MASRRSAAALCAAVLSFAALLSPPRAPAAPAAAATPARIATLPNGLRIVVLEDHAAPVAQVATTYRFGAADETPGKTGLAHALEHMMFRGTPTLSSAALDDWTARLGVYMNAQTTNASTQFVFVVPADRVATALRIEADRMTHLALRPADWERERGAVLQEYAQDESSPFFRLHFGVDERLYPGSTLARSALGVKDDIRRATVADLRRYYERWYGPDHATIVVTGDVDGARIIDAARATFGGLARRGGGEERLPTATPAAAPAPLTLAGDVPFTVLDLAWPAPPANGATEDAGDRAVVAAIALNNARGTLRQRLTDSGLTYGVAFQPSSERGILSLHALAVVQPGHRPEEVRAALDAFLADTLGRGIEPEFVDAAKRAALNGLVYTRDSITGLANALGSGYVFPGDTDPGAYAARIEAITPAQVSAVAREVFLRHRPAVGTLTPTTTDPSKAQAPRPIAGAISDDFGGRVPDGPIVRPAWLAADAARPLDLHSRVRPVRSVLPNGLTLLVQRVPENPTVFVEGAIRTPAGAAPAGKDGVGELTSALLGYGSARYDYAAQHKLADDLGATISFGQEFAAHGRAADTDRLLDAFLDAVRAPLLPASRFDLIRAQARASAERGELQPQTRAAHAFADALYPAGDPARRRPTATTLDAVTIDDVRAFRARWYRPDLTTLVVVGDVDPDAVRTEVARLTDGWTASGPRPDETLPPLPFPAPSRQQVDASTTDVSVELGQPAPSRRDRDVDAFLLADALLDDQSFESRLFREVREKRGLVYSIGTRFSPGRDRGTETITFRAVPSKVDAAEAVVRAELRRLVAQPPTADELRRVATRDVARTILAEQATGAIAGDLMQIGADDLPDTYFAEYPHRYDAITPDRVREAATRWLRPDGLVEVRTGPR